MFCREIYMAKAKGNRPDRDGTHRAQFDKNRAKVLATREVCGICGRPVDKTLKWPHPFSPTVDHIIPIDRGGHPSDISNLQLAHWCCNRKKSNKIYESTETAEIAPILSNRLLPHSINWMDFGSKSKRISDSKTGGNEQKNEADFSSREHEVKK